MNQAPRKINVDEWFCGCEIIYEDENGTRITEKDTPRAEIIDFARNFFYQHDRKSLKFPGCGIRYICFKNKVFIDDKFGEIIQ